MLRFKPQICHLPALWQWATYLTSLFSVFPNSKISGANNSTLPHRTGVRQDNIAKVPRQPNFHHPNGLNFSRDSTAIAWMINIS